MSRIMLVGVILAAGLLANMSVALWIALTVPIAMNNFPKRQASVMMPSGERVAYLTAKEPGAELIKWHFYMINSESDAAQFPIADAPSWSEVARRTAYNAPDAPFFVNVRVEAAFGWPMRSLRWCYAVKDPPGSEHFEPTGAGFKLTEHQEPPTWHLARFRALPVLPVWIGLAVNTLVYAIPFAAAAAGWSLLRRHMRIRRGACLACGYPVGSFDVCPECGKPTERNT